MLAVLDRVHTPGRPLQVVGWARTAGFDHVSLDLIYGTPGETDDDFRRSLDVAVDAGVDHVSAYSLIVEPGTRMARQVRSGALPMPSDDMLADRYAIADEMLTAAGLRWYEVSNWARDDDARCRHNLAYWRGDDWWGIGPGAHSHVGGVRWWNVKHPARLRGGARRGRLAGLRPRGAGRRSQRIEHVLLRLRLVDGLPLAAARRRWSGAAPRSNEPTGCSNVADDRVVLTDPAGCSPTGSRFGCSD